MADKNIIISGEHKGLEIKRVKDLAYIGDIYMDFSKDNVLSYEKVDQRSGSALAGAVIAGTEGAIIGSNMKTYLVEIKWRHGGESLIKVTPDMFETIVTTTYTSETPSQTIKEMEEKSQAESTLLAIIIGLIWFGFYLLGSN